MVRRRPMPVAETPARMTEVVHGDRNKIRAGDDVLFQNGAGRRWQRAKFCWADEDRGGPYYHLLVETTHRDIRPDRVRRVVGRKQRGTRGGA